MRAIHVQILLVTAALAGCAGPSPPPPEVQPASIDVSTIVVPPGATLEELPGGAALNWVDVRVPFREGVVIPAGTTIVRLTGQQGEAASFSVGMSHEETGRRRCNTLSVLAWDASILGTKGCTGLAAVDNLPTTWVLSVGAAPQPVTNAGPAAEAVTADLIRVEFLTTPLDGPVAELDLTQLSQIQYELEPTQSLRVPSFDGTELYVEVTRPAAPGRFPVVIWSSPYEEPAHATGQPSAWNYFVKDWAMRGYVVVAADVRGYARSDGCVEVWGINEQKDQAFLVDWAAKQGWSDGNVGFYGQSYVGTTPVAAAVQAPPALKAIIAVAPVIDSYYDWHFGGVPNGESQLSPVAYQATTSGAGNAQPTDPEALQRIGNGFCDPTLVARANDPRALYDSFYAERNFSARAGEVEAAVLYTQGFVDSNVKSRMIPDWFNALTAPKLGLFGPWVHQHPTRADNEVLMLAWLDQYVKGKPVGLEKLAPAYVTTAQGTHRAAEEWPPVDPEWTTWYADLAGGRLGSEPVDGSRQLALVPVGPPGGTPNVAAILDGWLRGNVTVTGEGLVHLRGSLSAGHNAHLAAFVYDIAPNGSAREVTFGMINLAHRHGHDRYEPLTPGETFEVDLPLLPTEWSFAEGNTLRIEIRSTQPLDWSAAQPSQTGVLTLEGGADGVALRWPLAPQGATPMPRTAQA